MTKKMRRTIRLQKGKVSKFLKAIEQQFKIIPNTLTSVPGIGKVYSAGIIAEIGDIHRFQSQASVAKFAGLVWTQHQSGNFEAQDTRLIKSGNRFLRYYLLEAANSVRRCDSEFRRYYDLKYKEVIFQFCPGNLYICYRNLFHQPAERLKSLPLRFLLEHIN